jgi:hypothetical protein
VGPAGTVPEQPSAAKEPSDAPPAVRPGHNGQPAAGTSGTGGAAGEGPASG